MADKIPSAGSQSNENKKAATDSVDIDECVNIMECKLQITAPHERIRINKWRVRPGTPLNPSSIVLLYQIVDTDGKAYDKVVHKLKVQNHQVGVVKKCLHKEGAIVEPDTPLLEVAECIHTTVIKDMCADCGADLRQNENGNTSEASVPMVHSIPDLKVSQKLAQKLGHDDTRRLLQDRKLVLLVDLDQTVIHTTNDSVPNNIKGIHHFQLYGAHSPWYHTRLRPGTLEFLENISKYYELHICTFGARNYAHMIAQILDPDGKYFSHRILSRDECFNATSKIDNLKALFPNGDSMVCIIDDREDVWNMASNLIQVKPYHFFQHTGDINAPPGLSKHELDGEGVDFKNLEKKRQKSKNKFDKNETQNEEKTQNTENDKQNIQKKSFSMKSKGEDAKKTICDENESSNRVDNESKLSILQSSSSKKKITTPKVENSNKIQETENTKDKVQVNENSIKIESVSSLSSSPPAIKTPDLTEAIEIDDHDDYLLYLEVILKNVHERFYTIYDKTSEIADLKIIVPKIRAEVLLGLNLVFSGLVPTNMKLEQSRAYFIAKSLGANVTQNIVPESTHLVAVTAGTYKVNAAKKKGGMHIVNSNWLWSCAERWEHVDEKVFPLDPKAKSHSRQPPPHCHSPEHVVNYNDQSEISCSSSAQGIQANTEPEKFIDTINPLLSFSNADLADMNKEFDQFFESDSSTEDEINDIENPPVTKNLRKRKREEKEEDRYRNFFTRPETEQEQLLNKQRRNAEQNEHLFDNEDDDDDTPSAKFRRGEDLPSDLDIGSDSNSDSDNNRDSGEEGDWHMMGAALEREFLGLDD